MPTYGAYSVEKRDGKYWVVGDGPTIEDHGPFDTSEEAHKRAELLTMKRND